MHYLIDSHALIWFLDGDARLSANALSILSNQQLERHISIASLWEIGIKINVGRLKISRPLADLPAFMAVHNIQLLSASFLHVLRASSLPLIHGDPFDRMLIAQALCENLTVVTKDPNFPPYGVATIW